MFELKGVYKSVSILVVQVSLYQCYLVSHMNQFELVVSKPTYYAELVFLGSMQ